MKKKKIELSKLSLDKEMITALSKQQETQVLGGATINDTFPCLCQEHSKVVSCFQSECTC
jgi:hypothetical protein